MSRKQALKFLHLPYYGEPKLGQVYFQNLDESVRNANFDQWEAYYKLNNIYTQNNDTIELTPNTPQQQALYNISQQLTDMNNNLKLLPGETPEERDIRVKDNIYRKYNDLVNYQSRAQQYSVINAKQHSMKEFLYQFPELENYIRNNISVESLDRRRTDPDFENLDKDIQDRLLNNIPSKRFMTVVEIQRMKDDIRNSVLQLNPNTATKRDLDIIENNIFQSFNQKYKFSKSERETLLNDIHNQAKSDFFHLIGPYDNTDGLNRQYAETQNEILNEIKTMKALMHRDIKGVIIQLNKIKSTNAQLVTSSIAMLNNLDNLTAENRQLLGENLREILKSRQIGEQQRTVLAQAVDMLDNRIIDISRDMGRIKNTTDQTLDEMLRTREDINKNMIEGFNTTNNLLNNSILLQNELLRVVDNVSGENKRLINHAIDLINNTFDNVDSINDRLLLNGSELTRILTKVGNIEQLTTDQQGIILHQINELKQELNKLRNDNSKDYGELVTKTQQIETQFKNVLLQLNQLNQNSPLEDVKNIFDKMKDLEKKMDDILKLDSNNREISEMLEELKNMSRNIESTDETLGKIVNMREELTKKLSTGEMNEKLIEIINESKKLINFYRKKELIGMIDTIIQNTQRMNDINIVNEILNKLDSSITSSRERKTLKNKLDKINSEYFNSGNDE